MTLNRIYIYQRVLIQGLTHVHSQELPLRAHPCWPVGREPLAVMILFAQPNWVRAKVKRMFLQSISNYERLNEISRENNLVERRRIEEKELR